MAPVTRLHNPPTKDFRVCLRSVPFESSVKLSYWFVKCFEYHLLGELNMNKVVHIHEIIDCRDLQIFFFCIYFLCVCILAVTDPGQEDQDTSSKKVRNT